MRIPVMIAILDAIVRDSVILICCECESMMKSMWNEMTSLCGAAVGVDDDDDDVFGDYCDCEFRQSKIVSENPTIAMMTTAKAVEFAKFRNYRLPSSAKKEKEEVVKN
jgi:hypothetical protein